jgi:hypothetical protein
VSLSYSGPLNMIRDTITNGNALAGERDR